MSALGKAPWRPTMTASCRSLTLVLCGSVAVWGFLALAAAAPRVFYVAPDGRDDASGTSEAPFRTLDRARDAIRELKRTSGLPIGGVEVRVRAGEYPVRHTFQLTREDSGLPDGPIVYKAADPEPPRFHGGVRLHRFRPVEDESIRKRLPESARAHVVECDLAEAGVLPLPPMELGGFGSGRGFRTHPVPELFVDDLPMPMARWPNEGFVFTGPVPEPLSLPAWDGRPGSPEGRFRFEGDRPARWIEEPELWLYGYWFWDWADSYEKVERIDLSARQIVLAKPWHRYGYRQGQRYYAVHALAELDQPGEWYLDRRRHRLLFWPPTDPVKAKVELSLLQTPLVSLEQVTHVRFEGLVWECGAGDGVRVVGGENLRFEGCLWRKLGGNGLEIQGGIRHQIVSCDFSHLGRAGVLLSGGNRARLEPGGHLVENCRFHHLSRIDHTYTPGIWVDGVGHRIRHNLFHDLASSALRVEGNDHLVELNEAHRVVLESDDQGAVDMYGDPTYRGNVYRFNYFHHLGPFPASEAAPMRAGIRLDDAICGVLVYGNVFHRCGPPNTRFGGVQIHGGRDNRIEANLFVDTPVAVSFSPWDELRWRQYASNAWAAARLDRGLYLARYPELGQLLEQANRNLVRSNVTVRTPTLLLHAPRSTQAEANREYPQETALASGPDGRLRWDPAAAGRLGLAHIPFERIGLYADRWRIKSGGEWQRRTVPP